MLFGSAALESLVSGFLPLELVELDEKVIDVLEILNFVEAFKAVQQSYSTDIKDMDANINLPIEELDFSRLVVLFVE